MLRPGLFRVSLQDITLDEPTVEVEIGAPPLMGSSRLLQALASEQTSNFVAANSITADLYSTKQSSGVSGWPHILDTKLVDLILWLIT